jgi:hypothetical protein
MHISPWGPHMRNFLYLFGLSVAAVIVMAMAVAWGDADTVDARLY